MNGMNTIKTEALADAFGRTLPVNCIMHQCGIAIRVRLTHGNQDQTQSASINARAKFKVPGRSGARRRPGAQGGSTAEKQHGLPRGCRGSLSLGSFRAQAGATHCQRNARWERKVRLFRRLERVAPEADLPRTEIHWTEGELASLGELISSVRPQPPTAALIRAVRD